MSLFLKIKEKQINKQNHISVKYLELTFNQIAIKYYLYI
jgi:hypothetical protein